jgi:hypothetical protein
MHNRITILLAVLLACAGPPLTAEAQQETATKTAKQQITLSPGDHLQLDLEKANVRLVGWERKHVELRIVFSATHANRTMANRELRYMQYAIAREGNTIALRNTFILPPGVDVIHSKLDVSIELNMPAAQVLSLRAKYSTITLQHTSGTTQANLEFSDLELVDVGGALSLKAVFSEIRSESLHPTSFKSEDASCQFVLQVTGSSPVFKSRHSQIDLTAQNIQCLTMDAEHTDITLRGTSLSAYSYDIANRGGKIYMSTAYERYRQQDAKRSLLQTPPEANKPHIHIHTTFNSITIQ